MLLYDNFDIIDLCQFFYLAQLQHLCRKSCIYFFNFLDKTQSILLWTCRWIKTYKAIFCFAIIFIMNVIYRDVAAKPIATNATGWKIAHHGLRKFKIKTWQNFQSDKQDSKKFKFQVVLGTSCSQIFLAFFGKT